MNEIKNRKAELMDLFANAIKKTVSDNVTTLVAASFDLISNRVIAAGVAGADHSTRSQGMAGIPLWSVTPKCCNVITHTR